MKLIYVFIFVAVTQFLFFATQWSDTGARAVTLEHPSQEIHAEKIINFVDSHSSTGPNVKILTPRENEIVGWATQVRYAIDVTDAVDGSSKYGEITANECVLEIEYLPTNTATDDQAIIRNAESKPEPPGLSLIKTSTCFGCHADKTQLAGPSFAEIAHRYGNQTGNSSLLAKRIIEGSSGIWGNSEMPSHPDLTTEAAEQIAIFILEQGAKKYSWIYPGFEGTFRILDKPAPDSKGVYRLTASYTSKGQQRGQHSVILKVQ